MMRVDMEITPETAGKMDILKQRLNIKTNAKLVRFLVNNEFDLITDMAFRSAVAGRRAQAKEALRTVENDVRSTYEYECCQVPPEVAEALEVLKRHIG